MSVLPAGGRNNWRVSIWAGYYPDGSPNRAYFRFRGTKREAVEEGIRR